MKWYNVILCIVVNAVLYGTILYELIISAVEEHRQKIKHEREVRAVNEEYRKNNSPKKRRLCINCGYCRWRYYHPFHSPKYYWSFVTKTPLYCRKFKTKLNGDCLLTCISEFDSQAMHEQDKKIK